MGSRPVTAHVNSFFKYACTLCSVYSVELEVYTVASELSLL